MRWRARRAARATAEPLALDLRLERARFAPGETVRGSVLVVEGEGGRGEVRIALSFRERSTEYEAVAASVPGDALTVELSPGSSHPFSIRLPEDARPSYVAPHGGMWWTVDATAGEHGDAQVASRGIEVQME